MNQRATSFGDLLRRLRSAAALSQEALAERAGLSRNGISNLERGRIPAPRLETVRLLADALDLSEADRSALLAAARPEVFTPDRTGPLRSPRAKPPMLLTRIIGREAELLALGSYVRDIDVRLLSLTGPGGVGKTRLALEVMRQVDDAFPDGVVFVDLAPLRDPTLLLSHVAATLGLLESSQRPLRDVVHDELRQREMLLVLDNFEHLLDAAPVVLDLLAAGPRVKVLVTSRAPLRIRGEREYPVPPLRLPSRDDVADLPSLLANEAVAFFADRVQAVRPDFVLTTDNTVAVIAICQRLDGLPLALELAAARSRILPLAALRDRLDARLPLLTGGSRDAPRRQRTLRDTIAWSYDLLDSRARLLFRRLGVFVGGWTLESAEAVANLDGDLDVLEGLAALADQSLIRLDESGAEPRYTMLETIREFALERLWQHPEEEKSLRRTHAAFFADLALAAREDVSAGVPAAMRGLGAEEDNLRAMLAGLQATGDVERAMRVAGSTLSVYWAAEGRFTEARAWLERALQEGTAAEPTARAWACSGLAIIALFQGDFETARQAATTCRGLAASATDPMLAVQGPFVLSLVEEADGRMDAVVELASEAVAAARLAADPGGLGWPLIVLGSGLWHTGDLTGARSALEEAAALFHRAGGTWGESNALMNLAGVARAEGSLTLAARLHADSLRLRYDSGLLAEAFDDLVGIAEIAQILGYAERAARLLGAEDAYRTVFGSMGWGITPIRRAQTERALIALLGDESYRRAWDGGRALSTDDAIVEALALADELSVTTEPLLPGSRFGIMALPTASVEAVPILGGCQRWETGSRVIRGHRAGIGAKRSRGALSPPR